MGRRRRGTNDKKARTGAGAGCDRITALPLELRARIVSFLHFRKVVQLSALSRPWNRIHHHTPVVKIYLYDFLRLRDVYFDKENDVPCLLDEDSIHASRVALGCRAQHGSASRVDTMRIAYVVDDLRMRRHADRIVALSDAREIHVQAPYRGGAVRDPWALELPPAARHLEVDASDHVVPAVVGPGAAALQKLILNKVVLRDWPHLEAQFAPGAWCPVLEELDMFCCKIEQARVDILLPHLLKFLDLHNVDVSPHDQHDGPPFGHITIDAPEQVELDLYCSVGSGCTADYKSFTLPAPKLRLLCWCNQFVERVHINVCRPGSVKVGTIQLMSTDLRGIKDYQEMMARMLEGSSRTCCRTVSPTSQDIT